MREYFWSCILIALAIGFALGVYVHAFLVYFGKEWDDKIRKDRFPDDWEKVRDAIEEDMESRGTG